MDRRELQQRILKSEAYWGRNVSDGTCRDVGKVGCHDISIKTSKSSEIKPGEPYYEVRMDAETGDITITDFDGQGNEIVNG